MPPNLCTTSVHILLARTLSHSRKTKTGNLVFSLDDHVFIENNYMKTFLWKGQNRLATITISHTIFIKRIVNFVKLFSH